MSSLLIAIGLNKSNIIMQHSSRRNFLKQSALVSSSFFVPQFVNGFGHQVLNTNTGKTLVIIQWSGGNDGLNTVVPFHNDLYYKNRPNLAIKKEEVLKLNKELGLNPVMKGLKSLYDDGLVSIINNVGYPNPDRSHFRSMDIWHTASDSSEYWSTGWLGRYLDHYCTDRQPYHALEVDDTLSLALKGSNQSGFAASNPKKLKKATSNTFHQAIVQHHHDHDHAENIAYLYKTLIDTQNSANYLHQQSRIYKSRIEYPQNRFARDLKQIAELIVAGTDTKVYYANIGGFDTHVNQKNQQERLLKGYADAIQAFVKDLKQNSRLEDTLIMTFSEFGRRVKQNASRGTDHGTANNLYLIGGKLNKAGIFNEAPNLVDLDGGDLKYTIDFRQVYATILDKWLDVDAKMVLGKSFIPLDLI